LETKSKLQHDDVYGVVKSIKQSLSIYCLVCISLVFFVCLINDKTNTHVSLVFLVTFFY